MELFIWNLARISIENFKKTWKIHLVLCLENGWTSCFAHLTCTIRIEIRIRTFLEPNIPPVREIFEKNRDNITIYGNNSDSVGCLGKKTIFVLFVFKCVFHSLFAWTWMIHSREVVTVYFDRGICTENRTKPGKFCSIGRREECFILS